VQSGLSSLLGLLFADESNLLGLARVRPYLEQAARLGVRDYYFTGGEPFLNPEMEKILEATLAYGPATVLTNGLLLHKRRCQRLRAIAERADYSMDLRVSLDGVDAQSNDAIRGPGTFRRVLRGLRNLADSGINPVITVTEACPEVGSDVGKQRFYELLVKQGIRKPRLKILPLFQIGAEVERSRAYASWQSLRDCETPDGNWDHLQCSSSRMVTEQGVWVCPILVNEPSGRMGSTLIESLDGFPLQHQACWTCHAQGATCRT
jgi:molybdenum cofactor biosynthesis enzyme MoaA